MSIKSFLIVAVTGLAVATAAEAAYAALQGPTNAAAPSAVSAGYQKITERLVRDPDFYQQKHHGRGNGPSRITHCVNTSQRVWNETQRTWVMDFGTVCYRLGEH